MLLMTTFGELAVMAFSSGNLFGTLGLAGTSDGRIRMRRACASLASACLLLMGGCEFQCRGQAPGPAEQVGRTIDKAVDDVKNAVKDAKNGDGKVKVEVKP